VSRLLSDSFGDTGKPMDESSTVYVALLDEGVDVWRPAAAEQIAPYLFRLLGPVPPGECWQFQPGEVVRCEVRVLAEGPTLVAVGSRSTAR
jgi:hypothetical protein